MMRRQFMALLASAGGIGFESGARPGAVRVADFTATLADADPTGRADTSAALNAALNAWPSVYVPPGTYSIRRQVRIPAGRTLFGAGMARTTFSIDGNVRAFKLDHPSCDGIVLADFGFVSTVTTGVGDWSTSAFDTVD